MKLTWKMAKIDYRYLLWSSKGKMTTRELVSPSLFRDYFKKKDLFFSGRFAALGAEQNSVLQKTFLNVFNTCLNLYGRGGSPKREITRSLALSKDAVMLWCFHFRPIHLIFWNKRQSKTVFLPVVAVSKSLTPAARGPEQQRSQWHSSLCKRIALIFVLAFDVTYWKGYTLGSSDLRGSHLSWSHVTLSAFLNGIL